MFGHSPGWHKALTSIGVKPIASDEFMTSTHWHLYARVAVGEESFDHIISVELEGDDPRVPGAYRDMAKQFARSLMGWLSRQD